MFRLLIPALVPILAFASNPEPLAQLGDARIQEEDFAAALLKMDPGARAEILADPSSLGNNLETILVRRAVAQDVASELENADEIRSEARLEAIRWLTADSIAQESVDELAVSAQARALFARDEKTRKLNRVDLDAYYADADSQGWPAALDAISVSADALDQGMEDSSLERRDFENVLTKDLPMELVPAMARLAENQWSAPIPVRDGYYRIRVRDVRSPSFDSADVNQSTWLRRARSTLTRQQRASLLANETELLDDRAQVEGIGTSDLHKAFVALAEEEAIVKRYKDQYLEEQLAAIDFDSIARDRYQIYLSGLEGRGLVDVAMAEIDADTAETLDLSRIVAKANEAMPADETPVQVMEALLASEVDDNHEIDVIEQDDLDLASVSAAHFKFFRQLMKGDERFGLLDHGDQQFLVYWTDFRPAQPADYDSFKDSVVDTWKKDVLRKAWNTRTARYREMPFSAQPERVAALRQYYDFRPNNS